MNNLMMSDQGHIFLFLSIISMFITCKASRTDNSIIIHSNIPTSATEINEGEKKVFSFNYTFIPSSNPTTLLFTKCAWMENSEIATVDLPDATHFQLNNIINNTQYPDNFSLTIHGVFVGRTYLHVLYVFSSNLSKGLYIYNATMPCPQEVVNLVPFTNGQLNLSNIRFENETTEVKYSSSHEIVAVRVEGAADIVFKVIVILLVFVVNLGLGCKTDINTIKSTLRKPIAPIVGFCSQFIIMPLTSFAAVKLFNFEPAIALGFFALGCSPGGSASNAYTLLLEGDVTLSITLTFISTLAALAMVPLWLYTLGRLVYSGTSIKIPYETIFTSLISLVFAVVIGLVIQHFRPRWAKIMVKVSKVLMVVFLIIVLTFGVYTNLYIFRLMSPTVLLAAAFLPYVGFILGGVVAVLFRFPRYQVLTIAIETGIQNTGITIVLLLVSLPHPEADISITAPITSALFTPLPLWVAIAILHIRRCCFGKGNQRKELPQTENQSALEEDIHVDEHNGMISIGNNHERHTENKDIKVLI